MFSPTAPLVVPDLGDGSKNSDGFTRRHGVIFISILELLGCYFACTLYIYALVSKPSWAPLLAPLTDDIRSSPNIVHGAMYVIALLFMMEFFQAICLLDGARRESLGRVRFWLYSMFTYLVIVSLVVIGMELGEASSSRMNSIAFINLFIRFLEIMIVYAWTVQEAMERSKRNLDRRSLDRTGSTTAFSLMNDVEYREPATPPPSYDSTVTPMPSSQQSSVTNSPRASTSSAAAHQGNRDQILPALAEGQRTTQWTHKWDGQEGVADV